MKKTLDIHLLDVDGVLVTPIGYQLACKQSVRETLAGLGCDPSETPVTDEDIAYFESKGIHDVWDISCILATYHLLRFKSRDVADAFASAKHLADVLEAEGCQKIHPPDVAFRVFANCLTEDPQLARTLLEDSRNPCKNPVTKLFQEIVLGGEMFRATYSIESDYQGNGLLQSEDKPAISSMMSAQLKDLSSEPREFVGVYTARPSLPPKEARGDQQGYSPEAEIALRLCKLRELPLIGMGMMDWLAAQKRVAPEGLTKPHTTHALAALLCSISGNKQEQACRQAFSVSREDASFDSTDLGLIKDENLRIFVFEDTVSGLLPMRRITEQMKTAGFKIEYCPIGITTSPSKQQQLESVGARVFSETDRAIEWALRHI